MIAQMPHLTRPDLRKRTAQQTKSRGDRIFALVEVVGLVVELSDAEHAVTFGVLSCLFIFGWFWLEESQAAY